MRNYSTEAEPTTLVGPWLEPLLPELIAFRRDLHAHPELSFKEFRTTDKLAKRLEAAGLKPRRLEGTGLTVDIGEGPIATALRGDIDALPDHRGDRACRSPRRTTASPTPAGTTSTPPPCSALPWCCSACTRNRRCAAPSGSSSSRPRKPCPAAPRAASSRASWRAFPGSWRCTATPGSTSGKIGTRIGAITSASDTIKIELTGRGGHTSRPHLTEDLVFALAQIAVNVPAVLSRRVDVRSGVSVVWGQISAGSAPNAIPASGYMAGTMRCLDRDAWHSAGETPGRGGAAGRRALRRGRPPGTHPRRASGGELRTRDRPHRGRGPRRDRRGRRGPDPAVHGRRGLRLVPRRTSPAP